MKALVKTISIICVASITLTCIPLNSCTGAETGNDNGDHDFESAQTVVNDNHSAIYSNPHDTYSSFTQAASSCSDSTAIQYLNLFRAISLANMNETKRCMAIQDTVMQYIIRNKDNKSKKFAILEGTFWNHKSIIESNFTQNQDSTITYFKYALNALNRAGKYEAVANICINIADEYQRQGKIANAAKYYRDALLICDSTHTDHLLFPIYSGLGLVYTDLHIFSEAKQHFEMASKFIDGASEYEKFYFFNSRGNCYYFDGKYDSAIVQFRKAYPIVKALANPELQAITETNIGDTYMMLNSLDSSRTYIERASKYFESPNTNPTSRNIFLSLRADLELRCKNTANAERYLKKIGDSYLMGPRYASLHNHRLERFYIQNNDYKSAYRFRKEADRWEDSLYNTTASQQISDFRIRFTQDTTELHHKLALQNRDKELMHLKLIIGLMVVTSILAIVALVFLLKSRRRRLNLLRMKDKAALTELRMENIRNRISPHMIFNVLSRETPNNNLTNLVMLLRKSLELYDKYCVSLAEELEFVDYYIANEAPALGDNFSYEKFIDSNCDTEQITIPSMMIHIFAENALKHGLRGYSGDKFLHILVKQDNDSYVIKVVNNGNTNVQDSRQSTHTGIKIITQTISILNANNANKMTLESLAVDTPQGHTWESTLRIPKGYDFTIR